jgi:hypothetical protein
MTPHGPRLFSLPQVYVLALAAAIGFVGLTMVRLFYGLPELGSDLDQLDSRMRPVALVFAVLAWAFGPIAIEFVAEACCAKCRKDRVKASLLSVWAVCVFVGAIIWTARLASFQ